MPEDPMRPSDDDEAVQPATPEEAAAAMAPWLATRPGLRGTHATASRRGRQQPLDDASILAIGNRSNLHRQPDAPEPMVEAAAILDAAVQAAYLANDALRRLDGDVLLDQAERERIAERAAERGERPVMPQPVDWETERVAREAAARVTLR